MTHEIPHNKLFFFLWQFIIYVSSILCGQIYHLCKTSERFCHERANNTYSVPAAFCAELTATAVGLLTYLPGTAVPYFMMGFPRLPYPFIAFTLWTVSNFILYIMYYVLRIMYITWCVIYITCFIWYDNSYTRLTSKIYKYLNYIFCRALWQQRAW